jgi:hypothetical protein
MQQVLSTGIEAGLASDFSIEARGRATALIERIGAELGAWRIVSESDRIEAAAVAYAQGDVWRLHEAVELALVDWRDLLVQVGDA